MDEIKVEQMFVGNEVVFDDLQSFKQALASNVFAELRADAENFIEWGTIHIALCIGKSFIRVNKPSVSDFFMQPFT